MRVWPYRQRGEAHAAKRTPATALRYPDGAHRQRYQRAPAAPRRPAAATRSSAVEVGRDERGELSGTLQGREVRGPVDVDDGGVVDPRRVRLGVGARHDAVL